METGRWLVWVFGLGLAAMAYGEHAAVNYHKGRPPGPPLVPANDKQLVEIVTQVKKDLGNYTAFNNCTSFALRFHQLAEARNIPVRTIGANCAGQSVGHAFNMVQVKGGDWFFIEPQGNGAVTNPGFAAPDKPSGVALCAMMGKTLERDGKCACNIDTSSTKPIPHNRNPYLACALNSDFRNKGQSVDNFRDCLACCQNRNAYYIQGQHDLAVKWSQMCISGCRNNLFPQAQDSQDITSPGRNDSLAVAAGRACVAAATSWSFSSKAEQCRGCCLDGAINGHFPRANLSSCQAVCNAEFK